MKNLAFIIYSWGSSILLTVLIFWLATIPEFEINNTSASDAIIKTIFRMGIYALLYIFIYRSIIITLKQSITRLSQYRSKKEKIEDAEFVLIIETLIVVVVAFACVIISMIAEWIQSTNIVSLKTSELQDVLVSTMSILLTSIIVYSVPVIGELEIAIKHWFKEGNKK